MKNMLDFKNFLVLGVKNPTSTQAILKTKNCKYFLKKNFHWDLGSDFDKFDRINIGVKNKSTFYTVCVSYS